MIIDNDIEMQKLLVGKVVDSDEPVDGTEAGHARCDCIWWRYQDHHLKDGRTVRYWFNYLGQTEDGWEEYDEYVEILEGD